MNTNTRVVLFVSYVLINQVTSMVLPIPVSLEVFTISTPHRGFLTRLKYLTFEYLNSGLRCGLPSTENRCVQWLGCGSCRPFSQLQIHEADTPTNSASARCDSPAFLRIRLMLFISYLPFKKSCLNSAIEASCSDLPDSFHCASIASSSIPERRSA